jgi:hypothetical protein
MDPQKARMDTNGKNKEPGQSITRLPTTKLLKLPN